MLFIGVTFLSQTRTRRILISFAGEHDVCGTHGGMWLITPLSDNQHKLNQKQSIKKIQARV